MKIDSVIAMAVVHQFLDLNLPQTDDKHRGMAFLWDEHRRTVKPSRSQIGQRLIGHLKRVQGRFCDHSHLWNFSKKVNSILPREVRDRNDLTLFPEESIRKTRDVTHVNTGTHNAATLPNALQRQGYKATHRGKQDGSIERFWRKFV